MNKIMKMPALIAGKEVETDEILNVHYPYTNEVIGVVPLLKAEHVRKAFDIAGKYQPKLTRYERSGILKRTADLFQKNKDDISNTITLELGISKKDSMYEIGRATDVFNITSQMCMQDDGQIFSCDITPGTKARRIYTSRGPLTAISAITPFNHPLNMVSHKIAPAIATNNCVVCKPSDFTPLTAIMLAKILLEAGLPPEMFSVVTGKPEDIGKEMLTNPNIEMITFTGGIPVGKMIAEKAGYRRTVLELGGNDPLIICDDLTDHELNIAATLAVEGATKNSGQRCTAVKRILCQEKVADRFVELVLEKAKKIVFGDPMHPDTDLGTVVNEQAAALFEERVNKAAAAGGKILYHPGRKGALLPPIVIDHVPASGELVSDETFGPIIPIIRVPNDDAKTIAISNSTNFALSSGVCTNRLDRAFYYIKHLLVANVNIWEVPGYRTELSPFGGIKDSGLGYKEGIFEAMKSFTNIKTYSLPWLS